MNTYRRTLFIFASLLAVRMLLSALAPVFDTSEARYAAIAANMSRTGDYLVPRFTYKGQYQSFDGKPPLQFQLSAISCRVFGLNEFAVRLPSLLGAVVMLTLLGMMTRCLADRRRAILSVGIAATSVAFYALAGCCMPDGLLTPCVAAAYCCYAIMLKTGQRTWSLGIFVSLALGMLTKGPVAIVLFAGPALIDACVNRRWKQLENFRWFWGTALFLAIAAPWFVLMQRENPGFLGYFFIHENLLRFLVHDYGDKYGAGREFFRGMAAIWALVVTLPWSLVAAALLRRKRRARFLSALADGSVDAVLAWGMIGITFFWCLTSRVPMAYLMPVVPLFAAYLSLRGNLRLMQKMLPFAALAAMIALGAILAAGMFTTDKMRGKDAPYRTGRYSYEFYHGPGEPAKEVEKCNR